jgi:dTMP kinase
MAGNFIVVEGADGFGKSTQVRLLASALKSRGRSVEVISLPQYDRLTGCLIDLHLKQSVKLIESDGSYPADKDALMFHCVHVADKYDAAAQIRQWLAGGIDVVCGRWWQSAYVYGFDDGLDAKWLRDVHASLLRADLNILFDLDEEEVLKRRPEMQDRYEKDRPKQARVRTHYRALWECEQSQCPSQWTIVDASGDIETVHSRLLSVVLPLFNLEA